MLFRIILNNIVFFFISICIDIGLIRFTNQNLERKRKLFTADESLVLVQAISLKDKVNKMIITNGILYFLSHVSEFVLTILLLIFEKKISNYCLHLFSCVEIIEMAQTFNLWSISLQFFVFKHFDKNFNESVQIYFKKLFFSAKH